MPLIGPPTDSKPPERVSTGRRSNRWYELYLDVPPWICPECQTTNFGRNKFCPYCRQRLKKETLRPKGTGVEATPYYTPESDT